MTATSANMAMSPRFLEISTYYVSHQSNLVEILYIGSMALCMLTDKADPVSRCTTAEVKRKDIGAVSLVKENAHSIQVQTHLCNVSLTSSSIAEGN